MVNTISLEPKATITPTEAKAKITTALVRKARFDGQHITVRVIGTEIELSGTVASRAEVRQSTLAGSGDTPDRVHGVRSGEVEAVRVAEPV
ncbi:hypothetical protein [Micromonospora sp. 050-3]|uniref:hypothetical protein n=1 Tax=Micromonospora sp. 050-3 TaxID=2789265 RepID=UPI00397D332D